MNFISNLFYLPLADTRVRLEDREEFGIETISKSEVIRTKKYQIKLLVEGTIGAASEYADNAGSEPGTVIKGISQPTFKGANDIFDYEFEHCHARTPYTHFPKNKRKVVLEPHRVRKVRKESVEKNKYTVIYFLNGVDVTKLNYQHRIKMHEKSNFKAEIESSTMYEESDSFDSWVDVQRLQILGYTAHFGLTPKEYADKTKTSFLILDGDHNLEHGFILSVSRFLSLIFGAEVFSYGYAKLDSRLRPNLVEYVSIPKEMFKEFEFDHHEPVIPLGLRYHRTQENIEDILSALINRFLELEPVYNFSYLVWYIIQFGKLPLETRVQPLATCFDSIMAVWYKQPEAERPKYLTDADFDNLTADLIQELETRLEDSPHKEVLVNKFKRVNEMGYVQQVKRFLSVLEIEPSQDELSILAFRHKAIHGTEKPMDTETAFRLSNGFKTLLVRVILKLLGYQGNYIDYASLGYPTRQINESVQVSR